MSAARHPSETDLALFAGGETSHLQNFLLDKHLRVCRDCQTKVTEYRALRDGLIDSEIPCVNWNLLAPEMRANIRVGLEAGACVRTSRATLSGSPGLAEWVQSWARAVNPRAVVGAATLALIAASAFYMRDARTRTADASRFDSNSAPVVQTTSSGPKLQDGDASLMLLNRSDAVNETVSARGDIRARVIEAGTVTITSVSLQ